MTQQSIAPARSVGSVASVLMAAMALALFVFAPTAQGAGLKQTCLGKVATIIGTPGSDTFYGTARSDVIVGLGGNDKFNGSAGSDRFCGGPGSDKLSGGKGNDRLDGGLGPDTLHGDAGDDTLKGGSGTDTCYQDTGSGSKTGCEEPSTDGGSGGGGGGGETNCTPGYSPCLPSGPSDYDCYGGSGNGPAYTESGVVYQVTGSDTYGLDADGDGLGCE